MNYKRDLSDLFRAMFNAIYTLTQCDDGPLFCSEQHVDEAIHHTHV